MDGSEQVVGCNYNKTYAPVAQWPTICLMLTLIACNIWHLRQLNYIHAYPQALVDQEMDMKIPAGIEFTTGNPKELILKVHKNIYGQCQVGLVWFKYL